MLLTNTICPPLDGGSRLQGMQGSSWVLFIRQLIAPELREARATASAFPMGIVSPSLGPRIRLAPCHPPWQTQARLRSLRSGPSRLGFCGDGGTATVMPLRLKALELIKKGFKKSRTLVLLLRSTVPVHYAAGTGTSVPRPGDFYPFPRSMLPCPVLLQFWLNLSKAIEQAP